MLVLTMTLLLGSAITSHAEGTYQVTGFNDVLFVGTYDECMTYMNYIRHDYIQVGSGYLGNTYFALTYTFGDNRIRFDFENGKMTWIDGTKVNITYTGSLDRSVIDGGLYYFTDDAVKTFCPEFAQTHSLIPDGVPDNFSEVLEKARVQNDQRLGVIRNTDSTVTTEQDTSNIAESYEAFDATDYADRYPDVKNALGTDKQALWNHYQTYGKSEGRVAVFR